MSSLSSLYWKIWKSYEHPGCLKLLHDLENENRLDADQWSILRDCRLRKHLMYVAENIPYYQSLFQKTGLDLTDPNWKSDFQRLPVLTKEFVRETQSTLRNPAITNAYSNSTGGSTGKPLQFYQDSNYKRASVALDAFVRKGWGIDPMDRTASIWGADIDFSDQSFRKKFYDWRSRTRGLNAFNMNRDELIEFLEMLKKWKPPYLMGYSSALEVLANSALEAGINGISFRAIRSSAEKLWPHQRRKIEQVFQSPVFDFYGSREVNNLTAECPEQHRMHLISSLRFVEVTDETGVPVKLGRSGYITVTDLTNLAMPLVRYRNDDMAAFSSELCPCGRPTPTIESLLGRSTDMIRTRRGDLIHGEFFSHLFYEIDDVFEFQVRQTDYEKIQVNYVGPKAFVKNQEQRLRQKIQQKMGAETVVEFSNRKAIVHSSSGKHRFTICELDDRKTGQC